LQRSAAHPIVARAAAAVPSGAAQKPYASDANATSHLEIAFASGAYAMGQLEIAVAPAADATWQLEIAFAPRARPSCHPEATPKDPQVP
jgi:hypothetical protein